MDIKEIEVICELPNYNNFSDAAYSLAYSPSVISKYVANVEEELGIQLLIRSKRGSNLTLTPEGKIIINALRRVSSNFQYVTQLARQLRDSNDIILRIGSQARLGAQQEQAIMASFLARNMDTEIHMERAHPSDLILQLQAGKLDVVFVTLHKNICIEEYYQDHLTDADIDYIYLGENSDLYVGVSDQYFPDRKEVNFADLKDFTFALPFTKSEDSQDVMSFKDYQDMASANRFQLKTISICSFENSIFHLARKAPVAVSTSDITCSFEGIHFLRIADWTGGVKHYFMYHRSSRKETLLQLKRCVTEYVQMELKNDQ